MATATKYKQTREAAFMERVVVAITELVKTSFVRTSGAPDHLEICTQVCEKYKLWDAEGRFPLWLSRVVEGVMCDEEFSAKVAAADIVVDTVKRLTMKREAKGYTVMITCGGDVLTDCWTTDRDNANAEADAMIKEHSTPGNPVIDTRDRSN